MQFEDAYAPQRLGNWQVPKNFQERPRNRLAARTDDTGHFNNLSGGRKNANHHLRFQVTFGKIVYNNLIKVYFFKFEN